MQNGLKPKDSLHLHAQGIAEPDLASRSQPITHHHWCKAA